MRSGTFIRRSRTPKKVEELYGGVQFGGVDNIVFADFAAVRAIAAHKLINFLQGADKKGGSSMKIEIDFDNWHLWSWTIEILYLAIALGLLWLLNIVLSCLYNFCRNPEMDEAARRVAKDHPKNILNRGTGSAVYIQSHPKPRPRTRSQTRAEREAKKLAAKEANAERRKKNRKELIETPDFSLTEDDCDMALAIYYQYIDAVPKQEDRLKREKLVQPAHLENIDNLDGKGLKNLEAIFSAQSQLLWYPNPSELEAHWLALEETDKESIIDDYCTFVMSELIKVEEMVTAAIYAKEIDVNCISDKRFRIFSKLFARFQVGIEDVLKELEKIKKLQSKCRKVWPRKKDYLATITLKKARETLKRIQYFARLRVVSDREFQIAVDRKLASDAQAEEYRGQEGQPGQDAGGSETSYTGPEDDVGDLVDVSDSEDVDDEGDELHSHDSTLKEESDDDERHVTFSTPLLTNRQNRIEEAIKNHNRTRNAEKFGKKLDFNFSHSSPDDYRQHHQQHQQPQHGLGHPPRPQGLSHQNRDQSVGYRPQQQHQGLGHQPRPQDLGHLHRDQQHQQHYGPDYQARPRDIGQTLRHQPRVPQPGTQPPHRRGYDQSQIFDNSQVLGDPDQSLHQRVMNKDLNVSCLFKVADDSGSDVVQFRNRFDPTPRELERAYANCPPPFNQQPCFPETRSTEKFFQSGFEGGFKFDGTWETFLSWQGMFIQNVHKVQALEVTKLRALMVAIETAKGPNANELRNLFQKVDHSAQCYFELIHQIVRDYGGHERMTRAAYDQLKKLGKVDTSNQTSMKNFMSILHRYTLAEESYGERGALEGKQLMDIVSDLLSWEDLNDYSKFLSQNRELKRGIRSFVLWGNQRMIQLDEMAFLAKGKDAKKTISYAYHGEKGQNSNYQASKKKDFNSGNNTTYKKVNLPEKCPLCSAPFHSFIKCKEWHKMSSSERHNALLAHNRCHSCTWAGHKSRFCTWKQRGCTKCGEKTHTKYTHEAFKMMMANMKGGKKGSVSVNHAEIEGPEDDDDEEVIEASDSEAVAVHEVDVVAGPEDGDGEDETE